MSVPHLCPAKGAGYGPGLGVWMCRTAVRAQGLVLQGSGSGSGERTARARAASCSCPSWPSRSPARPNRQTRPSATRPPTHGVGVAWHGVGWHGMGWAGTGWHGVAWGVGGMGTRAAALAHQRACRHHVHVLPCARAGMRMACRWCVWRTAQRGSASMSSGRHASERKGVSSKALLRVGLGLGVGVGGQG